MKPNNLPPVGPGLEQEPDMANYWIALRNKEYEGSFQKATYWVRQRHAQTTTGNTSADKDFLHLLSPLRLGIVIFCLALIVGACSYPVEINEPVATVLRWEISPTDKSTQQAIEQLNLSGKMQLMVTENNGHGTSILSYTAILRTEAPEVAAGIRNSLQGLHGVKNLEVLPLTHYSKKPLYAVALNNLLQIEVNAAGTKDAELEHSIMQQLQQNGITGVRIDVATDKNGNRHFRTVIAGRPDKDFNFDLTVRDGLKVTRIQEEVEVRQKGASIRGLSDKEIKAMVIKNHPELQLQPQDITVVHYPSKVELQIKKSDGSEEVLMLSK